MEGDWDGWILGLGQGGGLMNASESDLLPCPFCGEDVEIESGPGSWGYTPPTVSIKCCDTFICEATEEWKQGKGTYDITPLARGRLIEKWNRRKS